MEKDQFNKKAILNEPQRRGLSATFRVLEEITFEIEMMINSDGYKGILLEIDNDISPGARNEIIEIIKIMREKVRSLAEQLYLEGKQLKASGQIMANLAYCWEVLEGSKAKKLRGYGEVSEDLEEVLDPRIDNIIDLFAQMENIIKKG